MHEIESKFRLTPSQHQVITKVLGAGDRVIDQSDTYFNVLVEGASLRIRTERCQDVGAATTWRAYITFKMGKSHGNGPSVCQEIEPEIPYETIDGIKSLFLALGYTEDVTVKKTRREYTYRGSKIVVDYVHTLGHFLEVEVMAKGDTGPHNDIRMMADRLEGIIGSFGFDKLEPAPGGYRKMLKDKVAARMKADGL